MANTVKVRIAVAVDRKGEWHAAGFSGADEDELHTWCIDNLESGEAHYWLEAELAIPETKTVQAEVKDADD